MNLRCCIFAVLAAVAVCLNLGCGQQKHVNEMSRKAWVPEYARWPELDELFHSTEDGPSMERLIRGMSPRFGGDVGAVVKFFDDPKFKERLKKFEETPVPDKYKNPEREAAKQELVDGYKKLAAIGKKGDAKGFSAQMKKNVETYNKIITIPGQKPPEGAEALKYAPAPKIPN